MMYELLCELHVLPNVLLNVFDNHMIYVWYYVNDSIILQLLLYHLLK